MGERTVSTYTWTIFGAVLALCAVSFVLITVGVGGDFGAAAISDITELIVVGIAAVAMLRSARRLGFTASIGRPWLLMGLGALCFFAGDVIWTVIEVGMRSDPPYPGLSDIFYLLEYPLVAVGILSAGMAFRGLVPLKRATVIATVTAAALGTVVYFGLLQPYILPDTEMGLGEKILSTLYPLADVFVMIAPAVFVLTVVATLGGGRLAWPWRAVVVGAVFLALADTGYSWLEWAELYRSGSFIDWGWSLGHAFMMLGALIARDLARDPA